MPIDQYRVDSWAHVKAWWQIHFDLPIVEAKPKSRRWNKGEALHDGVNRAQTDVLILADSDSFLHMPSAIDLAIERVQAGVPWVVPHHMVHRLEREASNDVLEGNAAQIDACRPSPYPGVLGGGFVVLSREAWDEVGGIDPRFNGWGGEDRAFGLALATLCGPAERLKSPLIHLWHPTQGPNGPISRANRLLMHRYGRARNNPKAMRDVIDSRNLAEKSLTNPVRFMTSQSRRTIRLQSGHLVVFVNGEFETSDPVIVDSLRRTRGVSEV